jgi:serine/threonine-protein kinase RsbW
MRLSLDLPRESGSVPLVRHILSAALGTVGAAQRCSDDILLALAEACANAVTHAQPADNYVVSVQIDAQQCLIEVQDSGAGFDQSAVRAARSDLAESGRGLDIIRAVADRVDLRTSNPTGVTLRFVKRLQ